MKRYLKRSTISRTCRRDSVNPRSRTIELSAPNARIAKREIEARPYPPPSDPGRCARFCLAKSGNRLSVADDGGVCLECREVGA